MWTNGFSLICTPRLWIIVSLDLSSLWASIRGEIHCLLMFMFSFIPWTRLVYQWPRVLVELAEMTSRDRTSEGGGSYPYLWYLLQMTRGAPSRPLRLLMADYARRGEHHYVGRGTESHCRLSDVKPASPQQPSWMLPPIGIYSFLRPTIAI